MVTDRIKNFDGDVPMYMKINDGRTGEIVTRRKEKVVADENFDMSHWAWGIKAKRKKKTAAEQKVRAAAKIDDGRTGEIVKECECYFYCFHPKNKIDVELKRWSKKSKITGGMNLDKWEMEIIRSRDLGDSKRTFFLWRITGLQSCWTRNGDIELSTLITSANVPFQQRTNKKLCRWVCASPTRDMQTTTSKYCFKQLKSTREAKEYFRSLRRLNFNAELGPEKGIKQRSVGQQTFWECDKSGDWLKQWLMIHSTRFSNRRLKKQNTYRSAKGTEKQIDYILTKRKHFSLDKDVEANDMIQMGVKTLRNLEKKRDKRETAAVATVAATEKRIEMQNEKKATALEM